MRCRGGLYERLPRCQIHSPILLARGGGVFLCGERFLGFANFYCCFIFYYSRVAPPLTQLTSTKLPFLWTPDAEDGIGSWDVLIIPSSTDLSSGTQSLMNLYHQCVVAPASRDVGRSILMSQTRFQALQWGHSSKVACHLGSQRTISLNHYNFWWTKIYDDHKELVSACSIYVHKKASHHAPTGLL